MIIILPANLEEMKKQSQKKSLPAQPGRESIAMKIIGDPADREIILFSFRNVS